MSNEPSATLITLLRSTSILLEHYGYSEHDPTLGEIQSFLGRAIARLDAEIKSRLRARIREIEAEQARWNKRS